MNRKIRILAILLAGPTLALHAQWLNYPTAGVPRTPDGKPNLTASAPRTPDGKPDFSGLWETSTAGGAVGGQLAGGLQIAPEFVNIAARLKEPLPYQPWAHDLLDARLANNGKDYPSGRCLPLSILSIHTHPLPRKILQVPGIMAVLHEVNMNYRQIFTDGRPLPVDPNPSFFGYSSGSGKGTRWWCGPPGSAMASGRTSEATP